MFPPGLSNALDQFHSHWIRNEHEYNRDFSRGIPQVRRRSSAAHQDIDVHGHKLGGHALEALGGLVGEAMLKLDISSVDVAQLCEAFD